MRTKLKVLLAALAIGYAPAALAAPFEAVGSPPAPGSSSISLNVDAVSVGITLATVGPLQVTGSANADVVVDAEGAAPWQSGAGNGTLTFNGANLLVQDVMQTLVIPTLGTIDISLQGVGMSISSSAIPVFNNEWHLDDIGAPDSMTVGLNQGIIELSNPTGFLAGAISPEDLPIVLDLNTDPLTVELADLLGVGFGGTADSSSIGISIPSIPNLLLETPFAVYAVLSGQIYLQVVPEPSTYAMLGMGVISLMAVGRRRLRKA